MIATTNATTHYTKVLRIVGADSAVKKCIKFSYLNRFRISFYCTGTIVLMRTSVLPEDNTMK